MGSLVNRASFGGHKEPTPREVMLSEIRQQRKIENAEGFDEDEHGRARLTMPGGFHVVLVKDKD